MELRRDALAGAARAVLALRDEARSRRHDRQRGRDLGRARRLQRRPGRGRAHDRRPLAHGRGLRSAGAVRPRGSGGSRPMRSWGSSSARRTGSTRSRSTPSCRVGWRRRRTRRGDDAPPRERRRARRGARAHHVPAAMLFVPSRGGLSHTPDEFSSAEHCELGRACSPGRCGVTGMTRPTARVRHDPGVSPRTRTISPGCCSPSGRSSSSWARSPVWVKRQALDTDAWVDTSTNLLENDQVREALSVYIVDQLYANADPQAVLEERLRKPPGAGRPDRGAPPACVEGVDEFLRPARSGPVGGHRDRPPRADRRARGRHQRASPPAKAR